MNETYEEAMACLSKLTNVIQAEVEEPPDAETLQFYGAFAAMTWNATVLTRIDHIEPMMSLLKGIMEHPDPEGRFLQIMADRIARIATEEHADAQWLYKDVRVLQEGSELLLRAGTVSLHEWVTKGGRLSVA